MQGSRAIGGRVLFCIWLYVSQLIPGSEINILVFVGQTQKTKSSFTGHVAREGHVHVEMY